MVPHGVIQGTLGLLNMLGFERYEESVLGTVLQSEGMPGYEVKERVLLPHSAGMPKYGLTLGRHSASLVALAFFPTHLV